MTTFTKALSVFLVVAVGLLFVLTMFVPYPPARLEAARYFSSDEIEIGLRYAFQRRLLYWAGIVVDIAILAVFALTGLARCCADRFLMWTGQRRLPAALAFGFLLFTLHEALALPIGLTRLELAHAWGMSNLGVAEWLRDHLLMTLIELASAGIVGVGLYALLIWLPRTWWLVAPLGCGLLGALYAFLMPILINPLFNDFTPLSQTEWRDQEPRVRALIAKADVPVEEILVMNASRQGNHLNAYFTGFGSTRRIVLYDTLLKNSTPDEIESVLAHELGHWLHDHIVKGLLLAVLASVVGCGVLDRLLRLAVGRAPWNLQSSADPAGLPLLLLLVALGSFGVLPLQNAVSRHFEREADETSLELAGKPQVFIAAEQTLARKNYSNVAPTPWNVWIFATHPTVMERIRMAEDWRR